MESSEKQLLEVLVNILEEIRLLGQERRGEKELLEEILAELKELNEQEAQILQALTEEQPAVSFGITQLS
jgi:FixJ family two-component response regulator